MGGGRGGTNLVLAYSRGMLWCFTLCIRYARGVHSGDACRKCLGAIPDIAEHGAQRWFLWSSWG